MRCFPTMGGQTALNCALELEKARRAGIGSAWRYRRGIGRGCHRQGGKPPALPRRDGTRSALKARNRAPSPLPRREAEGPFSKSWACQAVIRPSFTLGGTGGGIVPSTWRNTARSCTSWSRCVPVDEVRGGGKRARLEVVRDGSGSATARTTASIICSIENIDPDGRAHGLFHHRRAGPDA